MSPVLGLFLNMGPCAVLSDRAHKFRSPILRVILRSYIQVDNPLPHLLFPAQLCSPHPRLLPRDHVNHNPVSEGPTSLKGQCGDLPPNEAF